MHWITALWEAGSTQTGQQIQVMCYFQVPSLQTVPRAQSLHPFACLALPLEMKKGTRWSQDTGDCLEGQCIVEYSSLDVEVLKE